MKINKEIKDYILKEHGVRGFIAIYRSGKRETVHYKTEELQQAQGRKCKTATMPKGKANYRGIEALSDGINNTGDGEFFDSPAPFARVLTLFAFFGRMVSASPNHRYIRCRWSNRLTSRSHI